MNTYILIRVTTKKGDWYLFMPTMDATNLLNRGIEIIPVGRILLDKDMPPAAIRMAGDMLIEELVK